MIRGAHILIPIERPRRALAAAILLLTPLPAIAQTPRTSLTAYPNLPIAFEANAGQSNPRVKFLAHTPGYTLFLTGDEAVLSLPSNAIHLKFLGAGQPSIAGRAPLRSKTNYFIGHDPAQWHANVPNYAAVEYHALYPGIDALFHGDNHRLEFDFNLAPDANPQAITLEVDGAHHLRLNHSGDIVLTIDHAPSVILGKPHIYQPTPTGPREIPGHYILTAANRITFALAPYNHAEPLVIDPTLTYATYLGGGTSEIYANAIAVDTTGAAYVTGTADASTVAFPTTAGSYNPGPAPANGWFPFISKLSPDGSTLVYSTYFGGSYQGYGTDQILTIAVDTTGAAYFGGISGTEDDTPTTPNSFMPTRPSVEPVPFAAKLSPDGSALVYSTFLDGSPRESDDDVLGVAVDSSGSAYLTGVTTALNFPTTAGALIPTAPSTTYIGSAFVTKLSPDGSSLVYSTYLGGSTGEDDSGQTYGTGAIAVDTSGSAYVTGVTLSSNFPTTPGAYSNTCNSPCDSAYVAKLNPAGSALVYSTLLGGTGNKYSVGWSIAVDNSGSAFVGGTTTFTNFPVTSNALQATTQPGFVTKLSADGSSLVYSSYFGGEVKSLAVGSDDSVVLFGLGNTAWDFLTTPDALTLPACVTSPTITSCFYAFLSKLSTDGSSLVFSTPFGGNQECCTVAGALDPSDNAYITGSTASHALSTTTGSYEPTLPGTDTGFTPFIAKFTLAATTTTLTLSPTTLPSGTAGTPYAQTITATGNTGAVSFTSSGSLPTGLTLSTSGDLSGTPTQTGTFPLTVTATDTSNDTGSQAYSLQIACPTITVLPTSIPTATVGMPYGPITFTETGGIGAVTFAITNDTIPAGFTFVNGVLSGETANQAGTYPFIVTVTDSNGCMGTVSDYLIINSPVVPPPAVVNDPETITVTDAETFPDVFDSEKITVADSETVVAYNPITILPTPASFNASSGTAYQTYPYPSVVFSATGGIGALIFTEAGTLPPGLTFTNGTLSGTPTTAAAGNSYPFSVTATDTNGDKLTVPGYTVTVSVSTAPPAAVKDVETVTVTDTETFPDIADNETITVTDTDTVVAYNAIAISPTAATFNSTDGSASAGVAYSPLQFAASGGIGTLQLTETGTLPAGITFVNGLLSGTPAASTAGNSYPFSVTATDADNDQLTITGYTLTIAAAVGPALNLVAVPDTLTIAQGQIGQSNITFTPSGGYKGTLALSCSGLPYNSLCLFSKNGVPITSLTLPGNNQPATVLFTIVTDVAAAPSALDSTATSSSSPALILWLPALLLGLAAFTRNRHLRRRLSQPQLDLCLLLVTAVIAISLTGCASELAGYLTPVGTSTVAISAKPSTGPAGAVNISVTITK